MIDFNCQPVPRILIDPSEPNLAIILRPLIYDCLLSIQHHFSPQRTHSPESPSHIFLGQNLSMKGVQVSMEDGSVERSLFLGVFGMLQHGWTWHHTVGLLDVLMRLYRLRCLLGAFPEPLGNYSIFFPMKLLTTTQFVSSNEVSSDCFSNLQLRLTWTSLMKLFPHSWNP